MRRARALLTLLLCAVVLPVAGCSGLPSSSGVQAGRAIDNHAVPTGNIEYPPPVPGASQKQIVSGFLDATAGTNQNYARAREFLTAQASRTWQPSSVVVTSGTRDLMTSGHDAVTVTEGTVATLDTTAHLTEQPEGKITSAEFGLRKVGGQWRISKLPKSFGLWMNAQQFKRVYQPQEVYYPAANGHTLVPDTQWYTQTGLVSSLAAAVVRGAPTWMRPMTLSGLPRGSELVKGSSVSVDNNGVASVNLSDAVLSATPTQRTGLWASMLATLEQVSEVRRVVVLVDGARLQTTDLPDEPTSPSQLGYAAVSGNPVQLVARTSTSHLQWTDPDEAGTDLRSRSRSKTQPTLPVLNRNWYHLAVSGEGTQVAAIDGANSTLGRWVRGRLTKVSGFGTALVTPSFSSARTATGSPINELWVAGQSVAKDSDGTSTNGTVWVLDTDLPVAEAQPQPVGAPWLRGLKIRAVRVSPDGERIAIAAENAQGYARVYVAGIVRDKKGHAQSLTDPLRVAPSATDVLDVGWLDYVTLAVLSREGGYRVQPVSVPIGGLSTSLGEAPGGEHLIATGAGANSMYVETSDGSVLTKVGATWQTIAGVVAIVASGT